MILYVLTFLFGVCLDFSTKRWAEKTLMDTGGIDLIKGVFRFTYVENRGAAFGILQNRRYIFILLTLVIATVLIIWVLKKKETGLVLKFGVTFVIAGAMGNMIDRVFLGYVVDFIDFCLINFPVFNVADCFVCVGAAMIAIHYIYIEKDKDDE